MDADRLAGLVRRHAALTDELSAALRSRGDIRAVVTRTYAETWRANFQMAITERRESCRVSTVDLDVETAKLDGEIEALRAELTHIELAVAVGRAVL